MSTRARVFWVGHSQAVRLPEAFRFDPATQEVAIRREGEKVILEPVTIEEWPSEFWEAFGDMPDGFDRAEAWWRASSVPPKSPWTRGP